MRASTPSVLHDPNESREQALQGLLADYRDDEEMGSVRKVRSGRRLKRFQTGKDYLEWGHQTFEAFVLQELPYKPDQADRYMRIRGLTPELLFGTSFSLHLLEWIAARKNEGRDEAEVIARCREDKPQSEDSEPERKPSQEKKPSQIARWMHLVMLRIIAALADLSAKSKGLLTEYQWVRQMDDDLRALNHMYAKLRGVEPSELYEERRDVERDAGPGPGKGAKPKPKGQRRTSTGVILKVVPGGPESGTSPAGEPEDKPAEDKGITPDPGGTGKPGAGPPPQPPEGPEKGTSPAGEPEDKPAEIQPDPPSGGGPPDAPEPEPQAPEKPWYFYHTRAVVDHATPDEQARLSRLLLLAMVRRDRVHLAELLSLVRTISLRFIEAVSQETRDYLGFWLRTAASWNFDIRFGTLFNFFTAAKLPNFVLYLHHLQVAPCPEQFQPALEQAWTVWPLPVPPLVIPAGATEEQALVLEVDHRMQILQFLYQGMLDDPGDVTTEILADLWRAAYHLGNELERLLARSDRLRQEQLDAAAPAPISPEEGVPAP